MLPRSGWSMRIVIFSLPGICKSYKRGLRNQSIRQQQIQNDIGTVSLTLFSITFCCIYTTTKTVLARKYQVLESLTEKHFVMPTVCYSLYFIHKYKNNKTARDMIESALRVYIILFNILTRNRVISFYYTE